MATDARKLAYVLTITDDSSSGLKSADEGAEKLHGRFMGLQQAGTVAATGIAAVTTEAVALGTALFAMGSQVDDAYDKIRIGTGKTGETFAALQGQVDAALVNIPTNLDKASTAVAILNQRLGEGGQERQQLVEDILELSRLTGTDLTQNLNNSAAVFRSWNVAADEQSEVLNQLLRAYQATGTSVTTLGSTVSDLGPILRTVGLGLSESIALTAALEREGIQTDAVVRGLNTAIGKLAEQGISAADALPDLLATIRDMKDPTDAIGLSIDLFGSRAGPRLAEAIRAGRLEISGLLDDVENGSETIRGLAGDTDDAAQLMEKAWGRVQVAAKPATTAVFDFATMTLNTAIPAVEEFSRNLENIETLLKLVGERRIKWEDVLGLAAGDVAKNALKTIVPTIDADAIGRTFATIGETLDRIGRENVGNEIIESGGMFITRAQAEENLRIASEANAQYLNSLAQTADDAADIVEEGNKKAGALAGGALNEGLVSALRAKKGDTAKAGAEHAESAIEGFVAAMGANRANLQDRFGDFGSSAATALTTALVENTKSSGAAAFREVENIVLKLQKEGVPQWRDLGDDLAGAFHDALLRPMDATKQAALDKLDELADVLKRHRALTPENLLASLDEALNLQSLGSGGASILEGLNRAIEQGGEQARTALARSAASWIDEVRRGLPPERAEAIVSEFTDALARAAEDNSDEAKTALQDMFRAVRLEIPMAALDSAFDEAQRRIRDTRDEALAAAAESRRISQDVQSRRDALKSDQDDRLKGLQSTFPDENLRPAEEATKRITDAQLQGQEAVNAAHFRGDAQAVNAARLAVEKQVKAIQEQAATQERESNRRQDQEQAIAALRQTFAGENARLEAQLSQEAYDRQITQINDRAARDLATAQAKYDQDAANLNTTLGLVQSVTEAADKMFDGALEDIVAIVSQSSTLAEALQRTTPGGLGGALNEQAAAEAQDTGQRAVEQNVTINNYGIMGEDAIDQLIEDQQDEALALARSLG